MTMNLTLLELFAVIGLAILLIMPVLYSIVITILFAKSIGDYKDLEFNYNRLGEKAEKMQAIIDEQRPVKAAHNGKSKAIKCGFAVPEEEKDESGT